MTNQDDARVAEMVGYDRGESDPTDEFYLPGLEYWISPYGVMDDVPPAFTTVPTDETDGIVLRWVQGQEPAIRTLFWSALKDVIIERDEFMEKTQFPLASFLDNYKPGMYAQALLATREEERGE